MLSKLPNAYTNKLLCPSILQVNEARTFVLSLRLLRIHGHLVLSKWVLLAIGLRGLLFVLVVLLLLFLLHFKEPPVELAVGLVAVDVMWD